MQDDAKIAFFLRHRAQITEWSKIKERAAQELDSVLVVAHEEGNLGVPEQHLNISSRGSRGLVKIVPWLEDPAVYVESLWEKDHLFVPGGADEFPRVNVVADPNAGDRLRTAVRDATRNFAVKSGYETTRHPWWVWTKQIRPDSVEFDFAELARRCARELADLYHEVGNGLAEVLRDHRHPPAPP